MPGYTQRMLQIGGRALRRWDGGKGPSLKDTFVFVVINDWCVGNMNGKIKSLV